MKNTLEKIKDLFDIYDQNSEISESYSDFLFISYSFLRAIYLELVSGILFLEIDPTLGGGVYSLSSSDS
jgi:hypothetical protein